MERVEGIVADRDRVSDALGTAPTQANFVWLPTPAGDADYPRRVSEALAGHGVVVRAFPEGVRVTVSTPEENDRLLEAWRAAGL